MRIGIDFGTCYSSAALMLNGTLKPVKEPSKQGSSFPSSIFVKQDEDKIFVGEAAERQRRLDPECYWREFKRDLGRTEPSKLGNRQILPEEAISEIIRTLKTEAERMVTEPLTGAVITVPANYQSYKQQLMEQAAKQAGFSDVEIITEPVAAAIYHARKGGGERTMKDGDIILVYDLGGGTFDAALIQKRGGGFELLAQPVGDEQCGGIDFDRQIYADLKGRCSETFRELLDLKRQDVSALRTRLMVGDWCREFKHQLSAVSHYEDVLMLGAIEETYSLSRVDFEGKIEPFISRTCQLSSQLVTEAGIKWEQVSQVLMVGGSCRIPYVRQRLEREFDRPVVQVDEPDLAVCLGSAIYGAYVDSAVSVSPPYVLTVALSGQGDYRTIHEAIENANPGTQILIKPGLYRESLVIEKKIELVGDGSLGEVVITSINNEPCLKVGSLSLGGGMSEPHGKGKSRDNLSNDGLNIVVSNLTLRGGSRSMAIDLINNIEIEELLPQYCTLFFQGNGKIILENCEIITPVSDNCDKSFEIEGIGIFGCSEDPYGLDITISKCQIHSPSNRQKTAGVFVSGVQIKIEDSEIFSNGCNALILLSRIEMQRCQIHDSILSNVLTAICTGTIENCEIFNHSEQVIDVDKIIDDIFSIITPNEESSYIELIDYNQYQKDTTYLELIEELKKAINKLEDNFKFKRLKYKPIDYDWFQNTRTLLFWACNCFSLRSNNFPHLVSIVGSSLLIEKSKFYGSKGNGILTFYEQSIFDNCEIFSNLKAGVGMNLGSRSIWRNCKIYNNSEEGMSTSQLSNPIIEDCQIYNNANHGIKIEQRSHPMIRRCQIHNNIDGIGVYTNGQGLVEESNIFDNSNSGVIIDELGTLIIQRCHIKDGQYGVEVRNGTITIESSQVLNSFNSNILVEDGFAYIRQCQIGEGKGAGVRLQGGVINIENSSIYNNISSNLELQWASIASIRGCQIYGSKKHGVETTASLSTTIFENCDLFNNAHGNWDSTDYVNYVKRIGNRENNPTNENIK